MKNNSNVIEENNLKKIFYAGIILYNPEDKMYLKSIKVLLSLGLKVVIFDNSTSAKHFSTNEKLIFDAFGKDVILLKSEKGNIGLGYPFNQIVNISINEGNCKGIYFFDQDSEVNSEAVINLGKSFDKLTLQKPFGIIAALAMRKEGMPYRIRNRGVSSGKEDSNLIEVDNVPSSFSLIPVTTFEKIGFFREDFFIDYLDLDFSLRCWKNNLSVYIAKNATFTHNIGIGDVVIFKNFLFPYSDEYRHYYQVRNLILSFKFNNIGSFKTLISVMQRIIIVLLIGVYAGGFSNRMYFLFKGIYHGYRGVSGKLNTSN